MYSLQLSGSVREKPYVVFVYVGVVVAWDGEVDRAGAYVRCMMYSTPETKTKSTIIHIIFLFINGR